jgi:hypothetical protein
VGAIAAYWVSPADSLLFDGVFPSIAVRQLQTLARHTLALTTFEFDVVLPRPLPVQPLVVAARSASCWPISAWPPRRRRAVLTRLATALAALQRQRAARE